MTDTKSPDDTRLSEIVSITVSRRSAVMLAALYTEHLHRMSSHPDSARMSTLIAGSARLAMTDEEARHLHKTMGTLFKSQDCTTITAASPFAPILLIMSLTSNEQIEKDEPETFSERILKQFKDEGLI